MQGVMRLGSWVLGWRRRCRRLLRVGAVATALLVAGLLAVGVWMLWTERDSARAIAVSGSEDLLAALDGDIARTIETYDLSLQSVADGLRLPGMMALSPDLRRALLLRRVATARYMGSMFVLDREGRTVIASEGPDGASFADREEFRVHRSGPDSGLFVGTPIVGRVSGLLSIPLSRRLVDENGAFVGIVGGVVHMDYLRDLFGHLRLTDQSTLTLIRDDGTVMAQAPWQPSDIGRNLRGSRLMRAAFGPAGTIYDGASPLDGVQRLHVFRRVEGLPLILVAGISPEAVDAPWWGKVRVASAAALGLVWLGAGLGALLRRELRRRGTAERSQRLAQARFSDTVRARGRRFVPGARWGGCSVPLRGGQSCTLQGLQLLAAAIPRPARRLHSGARPGEDLAISLRGMLAQPAARELQRDGDRPGCITRMARHRRPGARS